MNGASVVATFFVDHAALTKRQETIILHELADRIATTSKPKKEALPWVKLAIFGDARSSQGSLRHNNNLLWVTGIEIDYDGERYSFEAAAAVFEKEGIEAIVYTSPRHMREGHGDRWRGLIPFNEPHLPEERDHYVNRIAGLFRDGDITILAAESWTVSQAYYYGAVDHNPAHQVRVIEGLRLDHYSFDKLDLSSLGKPNGADDGRPHTPGQHPEANIEDIKAALAAIPNDYVDWSRWNVLMLAVFASCGGSDEGREAARAWSSQNPNFDAAEFERMWRGMGRSPPNRSGFGTLVYQARRADKHFVLPSRSKLGGNPPPPRLVVQLIVGDLSFVIDRAEKALLQSDRKIFAFGDQVVRPAPQPIRIADDKEVVGLRLVPIGPAHMADRFNRHVRFERYEKKKQLWVPADCPANLASMYLERIGLWRLCKITALATCPLLLADGRILDQPGFDKATGIYFDPQGVTFPSVPARPTKDEARAALDMLMSPCREFPFVNEESRSVLRSLLLSSVSRFAYRFVPLHAFDAPAIGTGKSKLFDCASIMLTGRECAVVSQPADEVEFEKKLFALLLAGDPIVSIDNCDRPLDSPFLCMILTQAAVQSRILGLSKTASIPNTVLMGANGCNFSVAGDMQRRVINGKLDAGEEKPWEREFESEDPVIVFKRERPQHVVAALTVLRAYIIAGHPGQPAPALGGFEQWGRLVRDCLLWLDDADPCLTMEATRAADPERQKLEAVITHWRDVLGRRSLTARAAAEGACTTTRLDEGAGPTGSDRHVYVYPEFRNALLEIAAGRRGEAGLVDGISINRLGSWLRSNKNAVVSVSDGPKTCRCRIVDDGTSAGSGRWRLKEKLPGRRSAAPWPPDRVPGGPTPSPKSNVTLPPDMNRQRPQPFQRDRAMAESLGFEKNFCKNSWLWNDRGEKARLQPL